MLLYFKDGNGKCLLMYCKILLLFIKILLLCLRIGSRFVNRLKFGGGLVMLMVMILYVRVLCLVLIFRIM